MGNRNLTAVRFDGITYPSEGALVNYLVESGIRKIEVRIVPDYKWKRMILDYRVIDIENGNFFTTSFFRVKKHLSSDTLDNIELFKKVIHNKKQSNFRNFGDYLDQVRKDEKRYLEDIRFKTMVDCVKEMRNTVL